MLTTLQAAVIILPMLGLVVVALLWGPDKDPDADIEAVARGTGVAQVAEHVGRLIMTNLGEVANR